MTMPALDAGAVGARLYYYDGMPGVIDGRLLVRGDLFYKLPQEDGATYVSSRGAAYRCPSDREAADRGICRLFPDGTPPDGLGEVRDVAWKQSAYMDATGYRATEHGAVAVFRLDDGSGGVAAYASVERTPGGFVLRAGLPDDTGAICNYGSFNPACGPVDAVGEWDLDPYDPAASMYASGAGLAAARVARIMGVRGCRARPLAPEHFTNAFDLLDEDIRNLRRY